MCVWKAPFLILWFVTWKLQGVARSFQAAAKIREETVQAPKQVKVFTQVGVLGNIRVKKM